MGKKNKKQKELEPQYYLSATHIPTLNYKVYYMSAKEKILYFLIAFVAGALLGYLFYGGIAKDPYGNPTTATYVLNVVISVLVGFIAGKIYLPLRTSQILEKRRKELASQFRDMLDGFTTAIGAGNNIVNSFNSVYLDMQIQYSEDAYIIKELEVILSGIHSNFDLEDLLEDFGRRSGNADIISFADVFRVCYRKGGNIQQVVRSTYEILSQKMTIKEDIETIVAGSKLDQMILLIMPVGLVGIIKLMSPEMAGNFVTPVGIISTTVALGLFVASYAIGRVLMDIKM